jgi:predicted nucleic acid-binding protein
LALAQRVAADVVTNDARLLDKAAAVAVTARAMREFGPEGGGETP